MQKIECSQNDFDTYVSLLQTLDFKAGSKTPSKKDLSEFILPNLTEFFTLLMWINNTGFKTGENAECRNLIRKTLNSSIRLTDNNAEKQTHFSNAKHTSEFFDTLSEILSNLDFKAGELTPSKEELCNVIIPNFTNFETLLLWIQETGYETEKNKECRELISVTLSSNLNTKNINNAHHSKSSIYTQTTQKKHETNSKESAIQPIITPLSLPETKIRCTYEDYDKYIELFQSLNYQAADYAPEKNELINTILPNLPKYIVMLMWIDETGYNTEENIESRKLIRKILMSSLELIDDVSEQE